MVHLVNGGNVMIITILLKIIIFVIKAYITILILKWFAIIAFAIFCVHGEKYQHRKYLERLYEEDKNEKRINN